MSLSRSSKTDFSNQLEMRSNSQKRRSHTIAAIKGKPTMEIYRPPNVRVDVPGAKLNVHAKEFTMNHHHNGGLSYEPVPLQHSKSSGSILRQTTLIPIIPTPLPLPLLHSMSSSHILMPSPHRLFVQKPAYQQLNVGLKRSKSLGARDSQSLANKLKNLDSDLGQFSAEDEARIKLAIEDPGQLSSRMMMDLVKLIMERVLEGIRYCEAGAKLCTTIIQKDSKQTFLESLLNVCQQWYQERDKILRGIKVGDGTRFTAFMWFLTEMCSQLKRHNITEQSDGPPDLVLLQILAKCCQACVSLPIKCLAETECLFFVLTSIGRDLEMELPQQLEQLLDSIRDGFLASAGSPAVRKTLLQLIELNASNWQLPGSSVLYYYPRTK